MSARVLAKNALWSSAAHLLSRGSLVLAAVVLARHLDTDSFAAYSYFQLTISLLAAYVALGFGIAASRFFAQEHSGPNDAAPLGGTVWLLSIFLACGAFVIPYVLPPEWLGVPLGLPRWILACGISALALQAVPDGAIIGLERYRHATIIAGFAGAITLGGSALAVTLHEPRWAMIALLAASVFQSFAESLIVIRSIGLRRLRAGVPITASNVRAVLAFSGPMFLVTLLSASAGWVVGRIILNAPRGTHEFAVFTIGLQWFALAMFIPGMVARVMLPRLLRTHGAHAPSAAQIVKTGIAMTTLAVAAGALALIPLSPTIARLYGARYQGHDDVIRLFLFAAVLCAPANALGNAILAKDGQWHWFGVTVIWYVVLIAFAWVLRANGAHGGGVAYVLAYAVFAAAAALAARRRVAL